MEREKARELLLVLVLVFVGGEEEDESIVDSWRLCLDVLCVVDDRERGDYGGSKFSWCLWKLRAYRIYNLERERDGER